MESYFCDFIGGAVHDNHLNALLSDEAKETIHSWSKAGCAGYLVLPLLLRRRLRSS